MSLTTSIFKLAVRAIAGALLKDADKLTGKAKKAEGKLAAIDKKFIAKRKALKAEAEKYRHQAIHTHTEQSKAKGVAVSKAKELHSEALKAKTQGEAIQAILK